MSTFTKLSTGKVIYFDGANKYGFSQRASVLPHNKNTGYIIISDGIISKSIKVSSVTTPTFSNRNDLIEKLSTDFFLAMNQ